MHMNMATLESPQNKPAVSLSMNDKAALFDQIWNDSSEGMVLAQLVFDAKGFPLDYKVLDANSAGAKAAGFPRAQVIGRKLLELFPHLDLDLKQMEQNTAAAVRPGQPSSVIEPNEATGSGSVVKIIPLNPETRLITFNQGLPKSNQNPMMPLQMLALAHEAILFINENGIIIDCNAGMEKIMGWPKEELIGQSLFYFIENYVDKAAKEITLKKLKGRATQINEIRCRRRDGTEITVETTTASLEGRHEQLKGYVVVIRDITEQKRTEAARRLSEEKFSKAFYNSQTIMAITRLKDGVYLDVNESWIDAFGYQREELIGKSALSLNTWADLGKRQEMVQLILDKGYIWNSEYEYRKKSGEIGTMLASINTLDINGEKCLLVSAIDITKRKKTEEALRLSEELFHKAFNFNPLPTGVFSLPSGKCLEANEALVGASGFSRTELIGNTLSENGLWMCVKDSDKFLETIKKEGVVRNVEAKFRTKTGEITTGLISGTFINWKGKKCFLGIGMDVTELRCYEKELARMDRLNLIGQIAAGIGHEIRNPMTTVRGFLQLMMQKARYAEDLEFLELMVEEIDRANAIITEFLSLARTRATEMKRQSLNQRIRTIVSIIQADALKQDKRIEVLLGDIPYLMIDKNQIHQLLLNLIYNGLEAMSPGGCLTIRTYIEAKGVTLSITDQGGLIPPAVREKLGTPFFTTKDQGTGLGLAVCHNIAHQHKAIIDLENDSAGTTFYVRFKL